MIIISSMNTVHLLEKYFPEPLAFSIIFEHSSAVTAKALTIARMIGEQVDIDFVADAAMLHDIGICMTSTPKIGCFGSDHYITHGIHGREILESEGLPRHAMVCERHIGVGLTVDDISAQNLPLPYRDMSPTCIEEEIICFADLFYSKKPGFISEQKSIDQVRNNLKNFGQEKIEILEYWIRKFGG